MRPDRRRRDRFVDLVFKAANIPLIHVPVRYSYATDELAQILLEKTGKRQRQIERENVLPAENLPGLGAPACPKCSTPMVKRTAKKGKMRATASGAAPRIPIVMASCRTLAHRNC